MLTAPAPASIIDSRRAWIATTGAALSNGLAFGIVYTFGTFFDEMAAEFGSGRGAVAIIFAVTLFFFFGTGVVAGPLYDSFGPVPLLVGGGSLFVAGLFGMSVVDSIAAGAAVYGIGLGIGGGFFISPVMATAGALFTAKRAFAMGIVATGSGLGTLTMVPTANALISSGDWRSAYRWLALIAAIGFIASTLMLVRPPVSPTSAGTAIDSSIRRNPTFVALFVVALLMSVGLFVAFAFIIPFAEDDGLSPTAAARLVAVIGLASIVGRLGLTAFSAALGPIRLFRLTLIIQMVAFCIWMVAGGSEGLLLLFATVLGVAYGGFVAISPEVAITLFGAQGLGRLMGYLYFAFAFGGLVGPPLAGWIDGAGGSRSIVLGGILVLLATALTVSAKLEPVSTPATT